MHGVELVGLDLDASAGQFTLDRHRLEAALRKLGLQRLLVDARHWFLARNSARASYRRRSHALNRTHVRSRCAPGAAPSALLRWVVLRGAFPGSPPPRTVRFSDPDVVAA